MTDNEFSSFLERCERTDIVANWGRLQTIVTDLMQSNPRLRGDLARALFYEVATKRGKGPVGIATVADQFVHFESKVEACKGSQTAIQDNQPIQNFMRRKSRELERTDRYLGILFYLTGLAQVRDLGFLTHPLMTEEAPEVLDLVKKFDLVVRKDSFSLNELISALDDFKDRSKARAAIQSDLGGMLEIGELNKGEAWKVLFDGEPEEIDEQMGNPSRERHFINYRFSSTGGKDKIVKSFLVIQSPGQSNEPGRMRDYFAFKAFYQPEDDSKVRRSTGAVIRLGHTITCFGSSRILKRGQRVKLGPADEHHQVGPKTFVFDEKSFRAGDMVIPGTVFTMNEEFKPISARTVCVEAKAGIIHSDNAGIGTFPVDDLHDDLGAYTVFADDGTRPRSLEERAEIWRKILEILPDPPSEGIVPIPDDDVAIPILPGLMKTDGLK